MFQVKATVIGFKGDEEKYPCHFQHKVGNQFIWDGEKFIGRICPYVVGPAITRMMEIARLGPRAISPLWYMPFWYAPVSRKDPGNKKYDGLGFRNVLDTFPRLRIMRLRCSRKAPTPGRPRKSARLAKRTL